MPRYVLPRLPARPGEATPRPYMVGRRIPGRAFGCDGRMPPPSGRGQALPDPPALRAGKPHRGQSGAVVA